MQPRYDFSRFWQNESLADTLVLIRIDGDVKQRIPGHGIVLANVSSVFKQEIEQQQGLNGRPTICMDVEDDQVPAASALVRFVYTGDLPEPSVNQQALLVHMLYLAHNFDVTDCRTACLNVLMQCQQMQPAALGLAFHLLSPLVAGAVASASTAEGSAHAGEQTTACPAGCEGFKALLSHCQDQLQQQLGDMEAVLDSPSQLANLHSLPLPALLALLQDMRTSAASENTVLAAVHSWMTAAAQRDIRVDATQREQLAAVVRIPLLEPCFLATVLPRMAWLLEILGPQGLATAAGVARGLCDPHAEPALSNARACGPLAAGWLQGPRPVPPSCSRATHGGPALAINWAIPLSDIRAAFEAACADATAKALLAQQHRQQAEAAAAAAAANQAALVSNEAPGWGLGFRSPMTHASVAAGMSAVASVAAAAAARVFNKRKRSCSVAESMDEGGRDQQSSSTAALGADRARRQDRGHNTQQQAEGADAGGEADHKQLQEQGLHAVEFPTQPCSPGRGQEGNPGREDEAEDLPQHTRKRPRRGAVPPGDTREAAVHRPDSSQRARKPASIQPQHKAGRDDGPVSPQARALGAAAPAGDAAAGVLSQQTSLAAGVMPLRGDSLTSGSPHAPGNLKLRSPEVQFAGYAWSLVLYFQPREQPELGAGSGGSSGVRVSTGPQAVAVAHAVSLPGDPNAHRGPSAPPAAAVDLASQIWAARLAVEARPAVALQPGSSTVAFSGQLGARIVSKQRGGAAKAAAAGRAGARSKLGAEAGPSQQHRSRAAASGSQDAAPSPSPLRRLNQSNRQARYTCPEAAAAGGGGVQEPEECERGPAGRQPTASDGGGRRRLRKAHAELLSIPESSEEPPDELQDSSESSLEETPKPSAVQDDEDDAVVDDDLGFMMVGEYPAGAAAAAAAAAAAGGGAARTPRSTGRRAQQQPGSAAARRRRLSADSAGAAATPGAAAVTPGPAAGRVDMDEEEGRGWHVLYLPQGSWLRSRRCDTGFTNFFSIQLQQGEWDDAVWGQFLQPGGDLELRGIISNVR